MTTRVTSPSTTARTAARRPAGSPLPCPPLRARSCRGRSPTIRASPSPARSTRSPLRTVMREGSSTPVRPRRWVRASSCSRPCLPTPLPGRSRREAAMASRTRLAHRRRAGPSMKRTSRRAPRAPSTGRPPLATPSNGTRCAPSSAPIPPRRPCRPPPRAASAPLTVTTPAQSPEFVQGAAASPATRLPSYTLTLTEPVLAGDLLVGWFSQFDVPGEVRVSDDVNGPWTRSVSTTWSGTGDIALYYRENSAPAPSGLRITGSASAAAYLQEVVADFRGVAAVGALDQAMVSQGVGTYASVGPTAPVPAGELVVAAVLTGGQPRWATPGSSERVPYLIDAHNGSYASDLEDILSSAAGPQVGSLTLGAATNWYMALAAFRSTGSPTPTTTSTTPRTTTSTSTTTVTVPRTTTTQPPTATSTSTTTTTTHATTTTTRPLLPCGGLFPVCLGGCPPGLTCTAGGLLQACACR